ncbi:MAG: flavodoxin domain-containing protein [Bryobacteraceae bacterium]|jgi:menaquinone-dependent protoporphyrinogen oxidase
MPTESIAVIYATREGQTYRIVDYLAASIRRLGLRPDVVHAGLLPHGFSFDGCTAAIVAASVHRERHEPEMVDFVKSYRKELERIPTVFLSMSLSQAGVEDKSATPTLRARANASVQRMIDAFLAETGWHPGSIKAVAGALRYTKYNFFRRFVMKQAAKRVGGSTDTSRDHEYTDWTALDCLLAEFVGRAGLGRSLHH